MTDLSAGLQAIFEKNRDEFRARLETLEAAVAAILAGSLDEALRASAESDAHKLVGALGTFGLPRGSKLAGELELRFARGPSPVLADDAHLAKCVSALRGELDGHTVVVPASEPGTAGTEPGTAGTETAAAGTERPAVPAGRILVVDDDMSVRCALAVILSDAGYDVRDVGSAAEARHALEHDTIALLLSDVSMPGETGVDLIRFAFTEHPQTATLLISALEDPALAKVAMDYGAFGYLSKPVRRMEVLIGVMNALRRREGEARERAGRENLERLVRQRTSALSQTLERLEATAGQGRMLQAESIHRWAQAAEHREPGVAGHLQRVSRYCAVMGHQFGLHTESLVLASMLHDVGKLTIPDSILLQPGSLSSDERRTVETHAEAGYEMLRGSRSSLLDLAAVIARTHHEKFDGSGYPHGLAGAEIPLAGRVVAVADVFDALTCDRVYRPAWAVEQAVTWMTEQRGAHFDPSVLDAFLSSMDEVLAILSDIG
jgi:putative two-component system response regulator